MGLRTVAAKLGFNLAVATLNKDIVIGCRNRLSLLCRRSNTTLAEASKSVEKIPTLYLCFDERLNWYRDKSTNLVVRPIQLDDYSGDECDKEEELLVEEAHKFQIQDGITASRSVCLGSKILFCIGKKRLKNICWVDLLTCPVEFHISSPTETEIKSFALDKSYILTWGAIDDKLYCFDNCFRFKKKPNKSDSVKKRYIRKQCVDSESDSESDSDSDNECDDFPGLRKCFEVLDPGVDNTKWQPLKGPPFIREDGGTKKYSVLFLNGSKKILGWEDDKTALFCFDTTKPKNGWKKLPPSMRELVPFSRINSTKREDGRATSATTLVLHDSHPKLGDFNLVLTYDCHEEPFLISHFFISDNCASFKTISGSIRLPREMRSEYLVDYFNSKGTRDTDGKPGHKKLNITCDCQFAGLGDKRFCLILHKFDTYKGIVLVLTFEYEFTVSNEIKMKTQLLQTRRYNYRLKGTRASNYMTGAFYF